MIWYLTKGNHKWSIHPLVRAWLRAGGLARFIVIVVVSVGLGLMSTPVFGALALIFGYGKFSQFISELPQILIWGVWILWVIDTYMDRRTTRGDLQALLASPNVVLATRGEYIGGHPQLPHGRFVYLTLGGTRESPQLCIVLPGAGGKSDETFAVPVLDLQKTTQKLEKTGDDTTVDITLASVTFRAKFLGEQATLNVEYIGQAGRKQGVEITRFLFGNGEIQTWRNFIVCIQAEADTGKPPYGPWKTLPVGKSASNGDSLGMASAKAVESPQAAALGAPAASVPPRRVVEVGGAQSSPPRTERPTPAATPHIEQPQPPVGEKTASAPRAAKAGRAMLLIQRSMGEAVFRVAFSPDNMTLAVASVSCICLCDAESLVERDKIWTGCEVRGVAFSPDGGILAAGLADRTVRLWRFPGAEPLKTLEGHADEVWSVAFSPDGRMLASGGDDGVVRLWQTSGGLLKAFRDHKSVVRSVAFSPDGSVLASGAGSGDEAVRLWSVAEGTVLHVLGGHVYGVQSVAFSPDGKVLAVGAGDRLVRLWRVSDGAASRVLQGHSSGVSSVVFSPDGRALASGSMDRTIRLWRPADGAVIEILEGHETGVQSVAFSADGRKLASATAGGMVRLWRVGNEEKG
jgi:WD40 repeat protein